MEVWKAVAAPLEEMCVCGETDVRTWGGSCLVCSEEPMKENSGI